MKGLRRLPAPPRLGEDLAAGVTLGLVSVPNGLATGLLAGISPVAGLYGYLVGTVTGAVTTSSVLMSVQGTSAMAVLIADVPQIGANPRSASALVTLTLLTGAVMLILGLLRLGWVVRFVPNAVLTGFINAVAVNIVLSQLSDLTGYESDAGHRIVEAVDTALGVAAFDWPTLGIGVATLALVPVLERTRLGALGLVAAVAITSVVALPLDSVARLSDVAAIPGGLPAPLLPNLSLVGALVVPALSLAFVGLVQGAAISQSVPNPDGKFPDVSGDFRGQGVANLAAGTFQGMPVGGSMSATALLTAAGGRSRWANLIAGAVMVLAILGFSRAVEAMAMPALAALLLLVGLRTFNLDRMVTVWRTGATQATVMATTFVLTLLIPLQYAVLTGVGISVILYVTGQSTRVSVVRLVLADGSDLPREEPPPDELPAGEVVVLSTYGSLFFASAPVFASQLPEVTPASTGSVVVLVLRGKEDLGSTYLEALARYRRELEAVGGRLLLAGVGERVYRQLRETGALAQLGEENVFRATPVLGEALLQAVARARQLVGGEEVR